MVNCIFYIVYAYLFSVQPLVDSPRTRATASQSSEVVSLKQWLEEQFEKVHSRVDSLESEVSRLTNAIIKRRKKVREHVRTVFYYSHGSGIIS